MSARTHTSRALVPTRLIAALRLLLPLGALIALLALATPALAAFGLSSVEFSTLNQNGTPDLQAGSHPYEFITTFMLDEPEPLEHGEFKPSSLKDVTAELPPGVIGNPTATSRCRPEEFAKSAAGGVPACPESSVVGYADTFWTGRSANYGRLALPNGATYEEDTVPVYNLQPPPGMPAEFAYKFEDLDPIYLATSVRTGGDYGVTINVKDVPTSVAVLGSKVVLWGVPAQSSHNSLRGACLETGQGPPNFEKSRGECPANEAPRPLLTTPTSCEVASFGTMSADSWEEPGVFSTLRAPFPEMYGCEKLLFTPSISVTPETSSSDSPSGLKVDLHVPQEESPGGLNEAELKDATVTLPAGMTVNPSAAAGLAGCSEAQIELHGPEPSACPEDSQIGTVELTTPLVSHVLHGAIYVAQQGNAGPAQGSNEFGSLLALYIAVHDPETGIVVKLAGRVSANAETGQLTTTFEENPQLPFEDLKLDFFGGEQAPLVTPATCGSYTATSSLVPWSGGALAAPASTFQISSGPHGGACGAPGFGPSFTAGTSNNQAGAFSPFLLTLGRNDGEQPLGALAVTMPPGVAGMISNVPECPEPQAGEGACGAESLIGEASAAIGTGSEPYWLKGGKVYLTGPYKGGPFGLDVVMPTSAGPYVLTGNAGAGRELVRSSIQVNPTTAQVTVVSDPFPTILEGIPLQLRTIAVNVNRPEFMFNPTNCSSMSVTGTIDSSTGTAANVSDPFEAGNCATLPFHPTFAAEIDAHHTRKDGEYLHVSMTSGSGQANIAKVHVQLPSKLPSRLETLKQACTEMQFAENPAGCPAGSVVGTAVAHTPILPVPMQGPAIFVSHSGAGFPNLDLVLQGDGVHITLVGDTFINKQSITTSTFANVPDVPVSRLDLVLPAGPDSALSGNGNMCSSPLYMPTTITGQNGAVVEEKTRISVSGCKPEIRVLGHSVKGAQASIRVQVPSAGTLVASGRDIERTVKRARKAKTVTIGITLSRHDRRVLERNPNERVNAKVKLRFTPKHGTTLTAYAKLLLE